MKNDIYQQLRSFLDTLPGGFPKTQDGVEIELLKKLFSPEQAGVAVQLNRIPEAPEDIAFRLEMETVELEEKLAIMAQEGLIMRVRKNGKPYYSAMSFAIGVYEAQLNRLDRELCELFEKYLPYIKRVWEQTKSKQLRVVPVGSALDGTSKVSTYNQIKQVIKNKRLIGLANCICSKERGILGHECDRPLERCVSFDHAAQYYIENGLARQISPEELLNVLEMGEKNGLVLMPSNTKNIVNICMCCPCCCGVLRIVKTFEKPADQVQSSFQAKIDREICTGCGGCASRCPVEAIVEKADCCEVASHRCIGCGLCVTDCPVEAISLEEKPGTLQIAENIVELHTRIAKERGFERKGIH